MAQCTPLGQKEMHYYSRIIKERTIIRGPQKKMLLWPVWSHTDMPKIHRSFHFFLSSDPQYGSPEWQPNTLTLQGQMVPPLPPSKSNLGRDTTTTCAWMRSQHPTACLPVTDPFFPPPPPPPLMLLSCAYAQCWIIGPSHSSGPLGCVTRMERERHCFIMPSKYEGERIPGKSG